MLTQDTARMLPNSAVVFFHTRPAQGAGQELLEVGGYPGRAVSLWGVAAGRLPHTYAHMDNTNWIHGNNGGKKDIKLGGR